VSVAVSATAPLLKARERAQGGNFQAQELSPDSARGRPCLSDWWFRRDHSLHEMVVLSPRNRSKSDSGAESESPTT